MLRLEKLEVHGFKSFGDRTEIHFRDGVTAIVGPNGCGKSNIGDAINWVLGEQSAKMLRGQSMADVIFCGSEGRKPLGLAEVSVIFGGAEGLPQAEQGRIAVTRRLFRSGESEYRLNGARSRLKDIQEILRQARVGARTYATIEQGKIDQVLNAKPKERRALIEDAAGIAGYKHKRRLAELKLEATYANLLRVNDIVSEVVRQINSLKRQAAKARRYRRLREELRTKELLRFVKRAHALDGELARLRGEEAAARDVETAGAARLARLEASVAEQREALEQARGALRETSEALHRLELEIDRQEGQIRGCRERIDEATRRAGLQDEAALALTERHAQLVESAAAGAAAALAGREELERLTAELDAERSALECEEAAQRTRRAEIEELRASQFATLARATELRNRARGAAEALVRLRQRRERLEGEGAEARDDRSRIETAFGDLEAEAAEHGREVARLCAELEREQTLFEELRRCEVEDAAALAAARERDQSARSRLATLDDLETRFAGASDGVKSLLAGGTAAGIRMRGVVADYVEASRDVEGAAERYMHWLLPTVILEDDGDTRRAADFLRHRGAGRTSLISGTQPAGALAVGTAPNGHGELPHEILSDRRVLGRLRDKLTLKASANGVVAERIGDAVLVDSLETALDLHRRHPGADYLAATGEVVFASGVVSAGGDGAGEQGLLAHRRRMEEARGAAAAAGTEAAGLQERVERLRQELRRVEAAARERRESVQLGERRAVELAMHLQRFTEDVERSGRRSRVIEDEIEAMRVEDAALEQEREQLEAESAAAEVAQRQLEVDLEARAASVESTAEVLRGRITRVGELGATQAASRERLEASEAERRRLDDSVAELEGRLADLRADAAAARALAASTTEMLARGEAALAADLERRHAASAETGRLEREIAERQETLGRDEAELRGARGGMDALRERTREAELARSRAEADREHLDDLCRQELGLVAADARLPDGVDPETLDVEALERQVEELKARIERIGPVNMTAIDEFTELEERHTFLTTQRQDLQQSMDSLRETIRRINRESRQRFTEAFEQIRASFQEVYQLLFAGGRADLRLEEGEEDVLECGIEILAQPPGKRLAGVHLLSGGEKALSAIALLFAIFRYQPSPFCMLDEVDAALDDSNVGRFTRMVGEYAKHTQFVIVTHNKLSMESADLLYGVTMEEPGVSKVVSLQLR